MKNIGLFLIILFIAGCSRSGGDRPDTSSRADMPASTGCKSIARPAKDPDTRVSIYPFKSGRFAFRVMGPDIESGTLTLIIDDYGHLESKRSIKTMTDGRNIEIWSIKKGLELYSIDLELKEVIVARLPERHSGSIDMDVLIREHGGRAAADAFLDSQGIRLLPDEDVQGYPCQVYQQIMDSVVLTRWVHRGVEFRMAYRRGDGPEIISREVITAEYDVEVPPEYFEYPGNFKVNRY
ncbi:MAG TPA: hypothetical protein PLV45_02840 [bacterium]|nr:hypothetical protein [bacterium]